MSQRKLRDDIRQHYLDRKLAPETLARLTAMAETVDARPPRPWRLPIAVAAVAATLIVAVGLTVLWPRLDGAATEHQQLANAIAEEIAMNHSKGLDLEFNSTDFAELGRRMDKLDFALVRSEELERRGLKLLGGRYCSIQGHLAAQLKLATSSGDTVTLYQTASVNELRDLPATELRSRGLQIELWQEEGIFLGLARAP